jgi:EmrB/QacA subfamily drug resistance transporter
VRKYRGDPWVVLIVVSLGFFMTLLDLTIVNIAIPDMITRLHASLDDILWVINAYALVLAVLLITAGRLGDLFGQRRIFVIGIVVFTAASAACGLAPNASALIAFRAVQGLGAAMLMPQTLAILTMVFPPERRGAAFGIWGAVAGVATIAGPTLGGLLVTAFDWRYIFFINLPIGIAVIALAGVLIPDLRTGRQHRLDLAGVVLASASLLAICYGLVEGQRYNWSTITSFISIPLVLGVGVVLLAIFLLVQRAKQAHEPLIPFSLFRSRNFALMNWVSGTVTIGMMGIFLPFTIYLQSVLGFSALKAGLTMAPASVISIFVAPVAGRLSDRIGGKFILMTGLSTFALGMGWIALTARTGSPWYHFLPGLIVAGFGMGCTFAPMTTVAMRDVQYQMAGAASGVLNTTRQVGAVIGTAAVGALLQNRLSVALVSQARARTTALPPATRAHLITGFQATARNGVGVGAGQGGTSVHVPPGLPARLVIQIEQIAHAIFANGFVEAMRATMVMPIAVLAIGALSCLWIKQNAAAAPAVAGPGPDGTLTAEGAEALTLTGPGAVRASDGPGSGPDGARAVPDGQVPLAATPAPAPRTGTSAGPDGGAG